MTQIIPPTPGRVVWFYPADHDGIARLNGQPLSGQVAGVHHDRLVNLCVLDAYGNPQARTSVTLVQPGDDVPAGGAYATWMPYQIGQAAKTEVAKAVADVAISTASVAVAIAQDAVADTAVVPSEAEAAVTEAVRLEDTGTYGQTTTDGQSPAEAPQA